MQAPREQDSVGRRPRLTLVRSELRSHRSGLGHERGRRLPAHPLEFDKRGLPIAQPPLTAAERLGRLLAGRLASRREPQR
jgi:hypothetical protein